MGKATATRKWTFNGRFVTQPVTGVQRYAHEIVKAIDRALVSGHALTRGLEVELVVPPGAEDLPSYEAITVRRFGSGSGHAWEQLSLPRAVRGGLVSLCNTGPVSLSKQTVCVHDVNTRLLPSNYSRSFRALYRVLIPALGARCETVTTVSHFSAQQIHRFGIAGPEKTVVVGNGHEHALRWTPTHTEKTRAVAGPNTIVVIGTPSPNKNVQVLLGMIDKLAAANLQVALIGATNVRVFGDVPLASNASNLHILGRLSEGEIAALLRSSLCLAFPSIVEGFGLPPVEAMAQGCPVVVSNTSCLPEICGDAALFADPKRADEWFACFERLRAEIGLRDAMIARGLERVKRYSWSRSAACYLELIARSDGIVEPHAEGLTAAA